jgi:hypothetical protein
LKQSLHKMIVTNYGSWKKIDKPKEIILAW